MSAVNPASLSTSVPPPISFGPGAVERRNSPLESRQAATRQWAQYQSAAAFSSPTMDTAGHPSAHDMGSPRFGGRVNASAATSQPPFGVSPFGQAQASGPYTGPAYGQFASGAFGGSGRGASGPVGGAARNPTTGPIARPGPTYRFP